MSITRESPAATSEVANQPPPLQDCNLSAHPRPLRAPDRRGGAPSRVARADADLDWEWDRVAAVAPLSRPRWRPRAPSAAPRPRAV